MRLLPHPTFKLAFIAAVLAGCGGGGGDSLTVGDPGTAPGSSIVLTAACTPGSDYLCSGLEILRVDDKVALTENGVQVYGFSTSDLLGPDYNPDDNPDHTAAEGLMLDPECNSASTCGVAEVRKQRAENGRLVLLLDNMNLLWNRRDERPMIIDTFSTEMGRATLDSNNVVRFSRNLPPPYDLDFYDWAVKKANGTQANYANNVYFPRDWPVRCGEDENGQPRTCRETESEGVQHRPAEAADSWRNGGLGYDKASASRYHSDGDLRAGDDTPDPDTGERRWIIDSSEENQGFGSAYPGFKGYRTLNNRSYQYANLATWLTSDTVNIVEWVTDGMTPYEHAKFRRGMVTFGDVTAPTALPASGTVTYRGFIYGHHVENSEVDIDEFIGDVSITVNYTAGTATITTDNTRTHDSEGRPVALPIEFTSVTILDPAANGLRNYSSGDAAAGGMSGGISARLFGPQAEEMGGVFSMDDAGGQTVIAGFIARKQ